MKPPGDASNEHLQQLCADLTAERDRLRQEVAELQKNYDDVRKAVIALMREDVEFDEEEILARAKKGQSLREFVEELEAELKAKTAL